MKFVMRPDLYIPIAEKKVFSEASTHSGINAGVIKAAWDAAGEVLRTWATDRSYSNEFPRFRNGARDFLGEKVWRFGKNSLSLQGQINFL